MIVASAGTACNAAANEQNGRASLPASPSSLHPSSSPSTCTATPPKHAPVSKLHAGPAAAVSASHCSCDVHGTHSNAATSQIGVFPSQLPISSAVQATHVCVPCSHTGVFPPQSASETQSTQPPSKHT